MTQTPFVGTWRLVSYENRTSDGQVDYPFGRKPVGYITYTDAGYMFVDFMMEDRPRFASEDGWQASSTEVKAAFFTHMAYCGRYEYLGDRIVHHIEVCCFPNWTGTTQERFFEIDGGLLSLCTAPFLQKGVLQSGHLTWERV